MTFLDLIERYLGSGPSIHSSAFVAANASIVGEVTLGEESSVWFGATLRGDINSISVGARSNIQDGAVVHVADAFGVSIGELVTVGHNAIVHACTIEDEVLVGMGAIVMDGAVVGARSIIGAGALVTRGMKIPARSMVFGSPARVVRALSLEEQEGVAEWARRYVILSRRYLSLD
jgi:carbonic anhydrase/acetyltransferase-like protein (isoleucine patch superfamily)